MLLNGKLIKIFSANKSVKKFFLWSILGLAFSQSVILSTLGLMSGFEKTLKSSLNKFLPDATIYRPYNLSSTKENLKALKSELEKEFDVFGVNILEGFAVNQNESSRAIRVYQIPQSSKIFETIGEKINNDEIILGRGLSENLNTKEGQDLVIIVSDQETKETSFLKKKVVKILDFPLYEQSERLAFTNLPKETNKFSAIGLKSLTKNDLESLMPELEKKVGGEYIISPYWAEFENLLRAVEVERTSIAFLLQIIVVVAIFNVVAFIIYFKQINLRTLFLLSSFGMSKRRRSIFWLSFLFLIWFFSSAFSLMFVNVYNYLFKVLPIFKLPPEVYHFSRLSIFWSWNEFLFVSVSCLLIIVFASWIVIKYLEKDSILKGLREEFQ